MPETVKVQFNDSRTVFNAKVRDRVCMERSCLNLQRRASGEGYICWSYVRGDCPKIRLLESRFKRVGKVYVEHKAPAL